MSLKVGELYGDITLNNQPFNQATDESKRHFEALDSAVRTGTRTIATAFTAVVGGATAMATAVFKVGADYNTLQQTSRAALSTLLGSAEAVNAQMDKLDDFARNSPFAKQVFITAQQQLLGFGLQADKVIPALDAIQNAVAAVGGSSADIANVTYALAEVQGQGKLSGDTLNQLGQYGINAADLIGQKMGLTGAQIRDMASQPGGIPADQVWDILINALTEKFGGATANIKQQFVGAVDRIKAAWRDIGSILAAPFIDPQGGGKAVEWANDLADALRDAQTKIGPLVDVVTSRLAPAFEGVSTLMEQARSFINGWDISKVNGQIDTLIKYAPQIAGVTSALFALGGNALGLETLGIALNPVAVAMLAVVAASPQLRSVAGHLLDALSPLVPIVKDLVSQFVRTSDEVIDHLAPALDKLVTSGGGAVTALIEGLAPAASQVIDFLVPLADTVADVIGWLSGIPTPVLLAIGAFATLWSMRGPADQFADAVGGAMQRVIDTMRVQQALAETSSASIGLVGTAGVLASSGIRALGTALKTAFITNPVGIAITAVSIALGVFIDHQQKAQAATAESKREIESWAQALRESNGVIDDSIRTKAAQEIADKGILQQAKDLGLNLRDVTDAYLGQEDAMDRVKAALAEVSTETEDHFNPTQGYTSQVLTESAKSALALEDALGAGAAQMDAAKQANKDLADATGVNTNATKTGTDAIKNMVSSYEDLVSAQKDAHKDNLSLKEAQVDLADTQNKVNKELSDGTAIVRLSNGTIDEHNEKTIEADKNLLSLVQSQQGVTDAMDRNNASAADLDKTLAEQRQSFIDTATQMGYTKSEAEHLADAYGLVPDRVETQVIADIQSGQSAIDHFITQNTGRKVWLSVGATGQIQYRVDGTSLKFFAVGGIENHVAQITHAGAPARIWSEPETGGEAYIPMALSKRQRSLAILDAVANQFGMATVPVRKMDNGGVLGAGGGSGFGEVTATLSNSQFDRLVAAILAAAGAGAEMRFADMLREQRRQQRMLSGLGG